LRERPCGSRSLRRRKKRKHLNDIYAHHAESAQILVRSAKLDPAIAVKMKRSTYGTSLDPALMQPVLDIFLHFGVVPKAMPADDLAWRGSPAYPKRR
jgi:hypothetical protein